MSGELRARHMEGERWKMEARLADPPSTLEGECWIRPDLAPEPDQLGTLRVDVGNSTLDVPIFAGGTSSADIEESLRIQLNNDVGYVPLAPLQDSTYPELRVQQSSGTYGMHDAVELSAIPDSGVARYDYEGDATDSWNNNDLTVTGSPQYVAGYEGQAANIDGTNDYFTAPFNFGPSDDFSVVGRVYFDAIDGISPVFGQRDAVSTMDWTLYYERDASGTADGWIVAIGENIASVNETATTNTTGSYIHVGLTKGGDSWTFYHEGVDDTSFTDSTSWSQSDNLYFGAWPNGGEFSNIRLDNIQWFSRELSASEVSNHYNTGNVEG